MRGKRSKNTQPTVVVSKEGALFVNTEVYVTGQEADIGKGIVQGKEDGVPVVRFWFKNITKRGERYLAQNAECITKRANHSALYIIDKAELTAL